MCAVDAAGSRLARPGASDSHDSPGHACDEQRTIRDLLREPACPARDRDPAAAGFASSRDPVPDHAGRGGRGAGARPRGAAHRPRSAHGPRPFRRPGPGRCGVRLSGGRGAAAVAAPVRARGRGRPAERRRGRMARRRARRAAALRRAGARCDRRSARCGRRDRHSAQRQHAAPLGRRAQGRKPAE